MICYELAIAYIGAYTFYFLNVRLPLTRDGRNVYQYLARPIDRLVEEAAMLMQALNTAANVEPTRENTLANVEETCAKIAPRTIVNRTIIPTLAEGSLMQRMILSAVITESMNRTRKISREILSYSPYVGSDLIRHLAAIDSCELFRSFPFIHELASTNVMTSSDLSGWAKVFFDYLQLVDHVENYRVENKIHVPSRPPELIFGTDRRSDAIPLKTRMKKFVPWNAALPDDGTRTCNAPTPSRPLIAV